MQSIRRSEVPEFLQKGSFCGALDVDDEGMFEVPSDCFKSDTNVESQQDLASLLRSLGYWGVETLPHDALMFILEKHQDCKWMLFLLEFPVWRSILISYLVVAHQPEMHRIEQAVDCQLGVDVARWLHENGCPLYDKDCISAAFVDDVRSLKYFHENGFAWDEATITAAIQSESKQCVSYALECLPFADVNLEKCVTIAIEKGSAGVLKFLIEHGYKANELTMLIAAMKNQLGCVKVLHEHGVGWGDFSMIALQRNADTIECLKYACQHGYDLLAVNISLICVRAVLDNNVRWLKFAHEQGFEIDEMCVSLAADRGHIECLQYIHEHGCEWSNFTYCAAWKSKSWACFWYVTSRGCPTHTTPCLVALFGINFAYIHCLFSDNMHMMLWMFAAQASAWLGAWAVNEAHVLRGVVSMAQRDALRVFFNWVPVVIVGWFVLQVVLLQLGVTLAIECELF